MLTFALDGVSYEFDEKRVMNVEAIAVKRVTSEHLGFVDFMRAVSEGDVEAITALVWIVRKRAEPELRFSDVEFNVVEFIETLDSDEKPGEDAEGKTDVESDPTDSTTTPEPT